MDAIRSYLADHRLAHLEQLKQFLRIPSISALSEHKPDMLAAAGWLADQLRAAGLEHVEIISSGVGNGNPIVYADWLHAEGKPTALIYGHYDVQPADPLHLWTTPPFEPEVRDGKLYARGAVDNKGQLFLHIKAVEAMLQAGKELPLNVKFLIEGEEEVGSRNLPPLVEAQKEKLKADLVVISDTSLYASGQPGICYALRGLCCMQVDVKSAKSDLHSGSYGGGVQNSIHALVEVLSSLHGADGTVMVEQFYDDIVPLSDAEKQGFHKLGFDEGKLRQELQVDVLSGGERSYSYLERVWARPTLEINGIYGGFQGEGSKTVIPAEAHAKITCRLVANQDPQKVMNLVEQHIHRHAPSGVAVSVTQMDTGKAFLTPYDHPYIQAAARAYEQVYGVSPVYIREGGSIPIVAEFSSILQAPVVLMGFGLDDENFHAPDEHFHLENFDLGLLTICRFYEEAIK